MKINIKKFAVSRIEKELKMINKLYNIKSDVAIHLLINNLKIYNDLLDKYISGDSKNIYLMYQMSSTIFKQLKEYNLLPTSNKDGEVQIEGVSEIKKIISEVEKIK